MIVRLTLVILLSLTLIDAALAGFLPKAFEARFQQAKEKKIGSSQPLGVLSVKYQYRGNFYMQDSASDKVYICNEGLKKVWVYDPPFLEGEAGNLTVGKSDKHCYSKIFDALSKGLVNNKLYKVKPIKGGGQKLTFNPKAVKQLNVSHMNLHFKSSKKTFVNIKYLEIFYVGEKDPLILTPTKLSLKTSFPKKIFKFVAPKNTNRRYMK